MLPTFIIGLREGLEAALIVGIIAAFLKQRGHGLGPMWLGVAAALALSLAAGLGLKALERALPQAEQEAMETAIGAVAVVFVTGMIGWMMRHAPEMKRRLQGEAAQALTQGGAFVLAGMAFLAVLREGLETSVFLLATFSAAGSAAAPALGATLGLGLSAAIGWALYVGGMTLDLGKFFRWTGAFLILVAAGLVMSALRTAHEAGWLNAGQSQLADLSWLVAPGSVQAALMTGVLGLPADPRLVEVVGWLAYLSPVALWAYWPRRLRPGAEGARRLKWRLAAGLAALAAVLALTLPEPEFAPPATAPLVSEPADAAPSQAFLALDDDTVVLTRDGGELRLPFTGAEPEPRRHLGVAAQRRALKTRSDLPGAPTELGLDALAALNGGRLPVGVSPARDPGPFAASWRRLEAVDIWTAQGVLLDAAGRRSALLTISGGGLHAPRTLRLPAAPGDPASANWRVDPAHAAQVAEALRAQRSEGVEYRFWARQVPFALLLVALTLAIFAWRGQSTRPRGDLTPARSA